MFSDSSSRKRYNYAALPTTTTTTASNTAPPPASPSALHSRRESRPLSNIFERSRDRLDDSNRYYQATADAMDEDHSDAPSRIGSRTPTPDINRNRLPTLFEVLSRRTLPPVDLFSFYIYMRDQQHSVDYLDFWWV